jgi:hypothetical protein
MEAFFHVEPQIARAQPSPVLDESTFQHILQAAFIIQQQNDERRKPRVKLDPAATIALIAETQEQLQSNFSGIKASAKLIAERLVKITSATGAAIALVESDHLKYCVALGTCAALAGSGVPIQANISEFWREEEAMQRGPNDVRTDLLDKSDNAPVFFPVYSDGQIVGVLQLNLPESESIQEHEIRSCQLMAGLMGESISRAAELEWKQSLAAERASMLQALEQLRPQLEQLVSEPDKKFSKTNAPITSNEPIPRVLQPLPPELEAWLKPVLLDDNQQENAASTGPVCNECGSEFRPDEKFCGQCGTRRSEQLAVPLELPFPLGLEDAHPEVPNEAVATEALPDVVETHQASVHAIDDVPRPESTPLVNAEHPLTDGTSALALNPHVPEAEEITVPEEQTAELLPEAPAATPWSSAVRAKQWLRSVQKAEANWLAVHAGDISVGLAAVVLIVVLTGWNGKPPTRKIGRIATAAQPSLTLFERTLIGLGLAEAPPTPVSSGNPNIQVWEDLHTGLYYCPGAEIYGKTPGGKVAAQRDAQLDQFEPAARKMCE